MGAMSSSPTTPESVVRLIGVYDADATVIGELAYWIGARLGRRHCSLCDITHNSVRTKAEWTNCRSDFPVPFDTYHRNDQPDSVRATSDAQAPVVVAETSQRFVVLLRDQQLSACHGSVDALQAAIDAALAEAGLTLTAGWA